MDGSGTEDGGAPAPRAMPAAQRLRLFSVCLALAALFHLAGNPRPGWLDYSGLFAAVQMAVALAAGMVMFGRAWRGWFVVLCVLIPASAWLEAPIVGNHWVLAAVLSAAYLLGEVAARHRQAVEPAGVWLHFAPVARVSLLVAYSFAAFAKLNGGFFDPTVSCAVFYQDQLVRSWGLGALSVAGQPALGLAVAIGAAVTELSVPVLLLIRRTRRIGLLLALSFHWVLALDWSQHFWDFSSVLFAGFLLFADDAVLARLRDVGVMLRTGTRPALRRVAAVLGALMVTSIAVGSAVPFVPGIRPTAVVIGHVAWAILGTATVAGVAVATARSDRSDAPLTLRPASTALLLLPGLVFLNGLTPYLEIKTGFGWNMYSNLRTVAGESNHFLVPATVDLTGLQSDRVEILETSDKGLAPLVGSEQEIVYSEFREYAHDYPDGSVTYRRGGSTVTAERIGDDAAGQGSVSFVSRKLQSYRIVDASGAERCQPLFTPAR